MRWFPLALFYCAAFAVAQNTPSDSESKKARIEGTIRSLNGEAVRKATVRLQGLNQQGQAPGNYSESTDNEGKFVFEDVAPGRYSLMAEKPGFVNTRYGARSNNSPGTQLNLTAGMEMKDVAIKMTPHAVIAGKVLDQDGDPVASVQVQVLRNTYGRGLRQLQPMGIAQTNDLGEYRIGNLAPGRYYVSATDTRQTLITQDRTARSGGGWEGNITTYYPNGPDASSAVPLDVAAGGEMRAIDIRLLRAKVYTVRGKAVDASGASVAATVFFFRKDNNGSVSNLVSGSVGSQLRPDGTFEFQGVVPGTYVLQVRQTQAPANVTGRMDVTVADANIDNLVLPLVPSSEIAGSIKLEEGDIGTLLKPSAGTAVIAAPARFVFALTEIEGVSGVPNTQVKEDGSFRFNAVGASKYLLNALALPPGTYLKSARFGGQDVMRAPIDTTSGAFGTLDLVLSSKAAEIAGSVQNDKGEPLAGVTAALWPRTPDASPTGGARQVTSDQNGGFRFQGLAPGDYYVAAWEELEPGLAQSAEFLSHFTSEASAVKLSEGGRESRNVKPVPSDKIAFEMAKLP